MHKRRLPKTEVYLVPEAHPKRSLPEAKCLKVIVSMDEAEDSTLPIVKEGMELGEDISSPSSEEEVREVEADQDLPKEIGPRPKSLITSAPHEVKGDDKEVAVLSALMQPLTFSPLSAPSAARSKRFSFDELEHAAQPLTAKARTLLRYRRRLTQ